MVHHITPISMGGSPHELSNLVTLCGSHHARLERETRREQHERLTRFRSDNGRASNLGRPDFNICAS
jgi:5-methylcytosine-specific restriction endonuclease McrA